MEFILYFYNIFKILLICVILWYFIRLIKIRLVVELYIFYYLEGNIVVDF